MNKTKPKQETDQSSSSPDTLERFQDLTRKLVKIPKEEVDEIDPLVQKHKKRKSAKQSR